MAWKDFLHFNKGERIGIFVLIAVILLSILAPMVYRWATPQKEFDFGKFEAAAAEFEAKLEESKVARDAEREGRRTWQGQNRDRSFSRNEPINLKPFRFNPNKLPLLEWQRMGIPENIANRIHNFERAGGSFRFKEDLARIYSITEDIYDQLEPFIDLPSKASQLDGQNRMAASRQEFSRQAHRNEGSIINLNTADSATLVTVRGIGPTFGRRIVNYRERLGGFAKKDQLLEVFGLDTARFELIVNWLEIDPTAVTRININTATWETLVKHPYINSNLASSIIAIRTQHGPYLEIEDLKKSKLVTDSIFAKIAPYVSVN